jgi:hypothetical protein
MKLSMYQRFDPSIHSLPVRLTGSIGGSYVFGLRIYPHPSDTPSKRSSITSRRAQSEYVVSNVAYIIRIYTNAPHRYGEDGRTVSACKKLWRTSTQNSSRPNERKGRSERQPVF